MHLFYIRNFLSGLYSWTSVWQVSDFELNPLWLSDWVCIYIYIHIMVIWINVSWRSNQWVLHVKKNSRSGPYHKAQASERASEHCEFMFVYCIVHSLFWQMVLFLFGNWVVKIEGFHVTLIGKTLSQATSYNYCWSPSWMSVTNTHGKFNISVSTNYLFYFELVWTLCIMHRCVISTMFSWCFWFFKKTFFFK